MIRTKLALVAAMLAGVGYLALTDHETLGKDAKKAVLKLQLPHEDAKVLVDGKEIEGTGETRTIRVALKTSNPPTPKKQTMDDYHRLADKAFKDKVPLVVIVGVSRPELEKDLADCLICRLDSFPEAGKSAIIAGVPSSRWLTRYDFPGNASSKEIRKILPATGKSLVSAGKDGTITVTAIWEPNNYTRITRKKTVTAKEGDITVDLSNADPKHPDDIVVRFVPTPQDVVEAMCKLGKVTENDVVYDLGCGDGRMVITAVKQFRAKKGVGVDLDEDKNTPNLIQKCREKAKEAGLTEKQIEFRKGDVLKVKDLSDATVVLLYMGDDINNRLKPILKKTLKPGARIVSHRFLMGDDWKPVKTEMINSSAGYPCDIHLWEIKKKE
jgi:precorrin-6B methylase 2